MADKTVQDWLDEIESGIEYREKYAYEKCWQELEDCYYVDPDSKASRGPNLIYSEGDTLLSSLTVPDPEILLDAEDISSVQVAPVAERVINRLIQPERMNLKHHVELGGLNSYLASKLILKIGYDSEFGWEPKFDLGRINEPLGLSATQFDKQGNRIEYMNTSPGMPWVSVVHPQDFVVPWGTGPDIENAPWVAHRIIRETSYFKKDPKYINTKNLEPQMSAMDYHTSYQYGTKTYRRASQASMFNRSTATELLYNEVWEIHDRMRQQVIAVCFTHDSFLRKSPNALMKAIRGYPFVAGGFIRSSRCFWTPPLAFYLLPHQEEIYDTYIQIAKQRRLNVAKFLMLDGCMEQNEVDKLTTGDVGAIAKVKKSAGKELQKVFMPFPKTASYDLMNDSEMIRRNTRDVMGFSRNQMGEFDASSRRTAYEAHRVFAGSEERSSSKEDVIKNAYIDVARKTHNLVTVYWTTPRPVALDKEWYMFTGSQLKGRFSYYAHLHSRSNLSKAQRLQQAFQMLMFMSQFPNIDIAKAEQHILNAVNDPSFEGFFNFGQNKSGVNSPSSAASASNGSEQRPSLGAGMSNNTTGL